MAAQNGGTESLTKRFKQFSLSLQLKRIKALAELSSGFVTHGMVCFTVNCVYRLEA